MAETILERGMLKTRVEERALDITTVTPAAYPSEAQRALRRRWHGADSWTAVWRVPDDACVWLHFWRGPTTPGGLEEAHHHVVQQVRAGTLPVQGAGERGQGAEEEVARGG